MILAMCVVPGPIKTYQAGCPLVTHWKEYTARWGWPIAMSTYGKGQRRGDIFRTANPVFQGARILGEERNKIDARMSDYPAQFESVVRTYGRDMVVQIISSLIDNGKIAARSNVRLEVSKAHPPSTVRRRQQDALEEAAAQSEAKAMDEASRTALHLYQSDQGGEQTDVIGHTLRLVLVLF